MTVNNYHVLDGEFTGNFAGNPNTIFIAVKNEQGSRGQYQIHAGPVVEPLVGPGTPYQFISFGGPMEQLFIDPTTGVGTIPFNASVTGTTAVVLNTPHGLTNGTITLQVTAATGSDVQIHLYDASHTRILQEDALPNSSHVATFTLPQLAAASGYTLGIFGLDDQPVNNVTLTCPVSTSSAPNPPATTDTLAGGTTETYVRAVPAPDGSFSDHASGRGASLSRVTLRKVAFYVSSAGPAHFSLSVSGVVGPSLSLYEEQQEGGEFVDVAGNLVDFVSQPGTDGTYSFDAYLTPGIYVLKVVGTYFAPFHSTSITATTPAYDATHITLDPTSAQNDQSNLQTVDNAFNFYGTEFYELEAPGGVKGPLMLDVHNVANANSGAFDIGVFKKTGSSYTLVGTTTLNLNATPSPMSVMLQTSDMPAPGDQYFIGVNRDLAATVVGTIEVSLGPSFMIPQPGLPDLVPQAIQLSPENGHTRVLVTIRNFGFGAAGGSHGLLTFSNYAGPSDLTFSGVGPFGSISYITDWSPGATTDTVSFVADSTNLVAESNENNNSASVALSSVDPFAPTSSFTLSDETLNGEGTTWGRFVSGVHGVTNHIQLTGSSNNLFEELITGGPLFDEFTTAAAGAPGTHTLDLPLDFGDFQPTSPASPNIINLSVIDAYGLRAPDLTQKVDVVPKSKFLTSITFDAQARKYDLQFVHDVVNEQTTLSQLFGFDVPVVGDKNNQFLVHVEAKGTSSLDPTQAVSLPLTGHILLEALDQPLYDESFDGTSKLTDHLTFTARLDIDPHTLDATAASASLQLQNLQLLHFQSPSIKLFSFGLPDVASIDASVKFGVDASLSAGVKIGLDPNILIDPLSLPDRIGVMSPTFIHPTITGTATAEGSVDVLGFDVASLSGTVALTLDATVGLDNNDPSKVFSFDDFFNHIAVKVGGDLKVNLSASVAIIGNVWSFNKDFPFTLLDTTTQGIITKDPTASGTAAVTATQLQGVFSNPLSVLTGGLGPLDVPAPDVKSGNDPVGDYPIDPHPAIVIDPVTGRALTLQVVNSSTTPGQPIANLSFAQRNGGNWSAPTILPSNDVAEPSLALTHDSAASTAAAVVVYEATNVPGSPASLTLNQKLADTDIRFRYFNGASFGPEQSITSDGLLDLSPSVAFNASGNGVVAWVHNTNPTPMAADGTYSRDTQEIEAAVWNPITKSFSPPSPIPIPFPNMANFSPASYVDDSGKMYVVWISGAVDNNVLMYSTSTGGAWSAPQQLPISGLTPGGSFKNLAIGRDALGRINVIFSYRDPIATDGSVHTLLLDRATTAAAFAPPVGFEEISHDATYSSLQTTNEPDGTLVAYWQKGDGVDNGVFYSSLSRSPANPSAPWTTPMRLTSTGDLTLTPSVAVDTNGHMDVLFHQAIPDGGQPAPPSPDPQVGLTLALGVGSSNLAALPELTFSNGLFFPNQDLAVAGSIATGQATILNRGVASAQVTIDSFVGLPTGGTLINTRQITLGPGSTYNYSQLFPLSAGSQTYSVRVTSATGEAVTTDDDVSAATLTGLADIAIASLTPSVPPQPGQPITLTADVRNLSTVPVGAFDVTLYSGDPHFPQTMPTVISTVQVTGLGSLADLSLDFPMTLPSAAGQYLFTAVADSGGVIPEAVETNNSATFNVAFLSDPAVTSVGAVANGQISHNNVTVTASLANFGNVAVANVPIHLQVSRDGGAFAEVSVQNVSIGAQQTSQAMFQADGLVGDNVFRVVIDASVNAFDTNVSNNFGQTELVIRGLPDLAMGALSLSHPNPRQGSPLSVQGVISNIGLADANNVLAEVFAVPTAGGAPLAVGSLRLPLVPGLGQVNLNLPVDTSQLLGGYTLVVQLNRLQEVLETTASNNSASISTSFGPAITISPLVINDGKTQRSMVNKLTVTFNTAVSLGAGAITLAVYSGNDTSGTLSDASVALGTPTTSDGGLTWVIPILANTAFSGPTGSLNDGIYKAIVHSSLVTDSSMNALAGGNQSITFHRLFGDIDGNGVVNSADYFKFKAAFASISGAANFNSDFDFDGNGKINSADYFKFKANFGRRFTY